MQTSRLTILFVALMACATVSQSAPVTPASAAALRADSEAIRALEHQWGEAFLRRDYLTIGRIVAPEFKVMRAENGRVDFTPRDRWLINAQRLTFHEYEVQVTDVLISGDTAVATVEGRWKVSRADRGTREERFILSDTWVKRDGRWVVIFRHSTPFATNTSPDRPSG